jgi:hypothetical protein
MAIGSAAVLASTAFASNSERVTWVAAGLHIERDVGAEHCPDKAAVLAAMVRLFPEMAATSEPGTTDTVPLHAVVRIRPIPTGHEASVSVSSPRIGERIIVDEDPDCHGLGEALALALVMLSDPSEHEPEPLASAPLPQGASSTADATARPSETVTATDRQKQSPASEKKTTYTRDIEPEPARRSALREPLLRLEIRGEVIGAVGLLGKPGHVIDGHTSLGATGSQQRRPCCVVIVGPVCGALLAPRPWYHDRARRVSIAWRRPAARVG